MLLVTYLVVRTLSHFNWGADIPWGWADTLWVWITEGSSSQESGSTTIRNLGLVIGCFLALALASWRTLIARREARTARESLLNERYQKATEMLGSCELSVRLGGIYALERLLDEDIWRYYPEVVRISSVFVRHRKDSESLDNPDLLRDDVQAVLDLIGRRNNSVATEARRIVQDEPKEMQSMRIGLFNLSHSNISRAVVMAPNFRDVVFSHADMTGMMCFNPIFAGASLDNAALTDAMIWEGDFSRADLSAADLTGARLPHADLTSSDLSSANMTNARLTNADLSKAKLEATDISGVEFSGDGEMTACGWAQNQLDAATADPDNPPRLNGANDAETGLPLILAQLTE